MKFRVERDVLADAVAWAARTLPSRPSLPVLAGLVLTAGDDAQANEAVECNVDGDALEIAFNPGYLLDGLAAIDSPIARFSFTQPTRPAVHTGMADRSATPSDEYRYLLMPVRLTG